MSRMSQNYLTGLSICAAVKQRRRKILSVDLARCLFVLLCVVRKHRGGSYERKRSGRESSSHGSGVHVFPPKRPYIINSGHLPKGRSEFVSNYDR